MKFNQVSPQRELYHYRYSGTTRLSGIISTTYCNLSSQRISLRIPERKTQSLENTEGKNKQLFHVFLKNSSYSYANTLHKGLE